MNYNEYISTKSQIAQLENLLERMPQERAVERMGLENRLKKIRARITGIASPARPREAYISFKGKPVSDNVGIALDFGGKAIALFSDIVTAAAAGLSGELKYTGPIPNRDRTEPILTGVATGSFGFTIKIPFERDEDRILERENSAGEALMRVQHLLEQSASGSDEELSDRAHEIHPRAVKKVHDLLTLMANNDAWFTLEFEGNEVGFSSTSDIVRCANRLDEQNIPEESVTVEGELQGIMPRRRMFELRPRQGQLIEGRLGPEISDAQALLREYLDRPVMARLTSVRVGQGTPRYTLREIRGLG